MSALAAQIVGSRWFQRVIVAVIFLAGVLPPRLYVRFAEQPQIDPISGHPIIDGAKCPF